MLGEPAVVDGLGARSISPRLAFELLVLVVVAPGRRLDRAEAARTLWPRYQRGKQLAQLRFTLSKLRSELARLGFVDILEASKTEIRLAGPVTTDVDALLEGDLPESNVSDYLQLPLAGWHSDVAHPIRVRIGTALGEHIYSEAAKLAATEPLAAVDLTRRFLCLHPFNTKVAGLQQSLLLGLGDRAGAEQTREEFERAWLDEYGEQGVPELVIEPIGREASPTPNASRSSRPWWGLAAVPVLAALVAAYRADRPWPLPMLGEVRTFEGGGLTYTFQDVTVPEGHRLVGLRRALGGSFLVTLQRGEGESRQMRLSGGRFETIEIPPGCYLADEQGNRLLFGCREGRDESYSLLVEGNRRHRFQPKGELAHGGPQAMLADGSVLVARNCNHGEGCHVEPVIYKDGRERPLLEGVGAQTSGLMFSYRGEMYGRYSLGKRTRWQTTCFRLGRSGDISLLRNEPLAAIDSKGTQVYEIESALEQGGQVQISPTGRFRVVDAKGEESVLSVAGTELFREVRQVGDLLFLNRGGVRYWAVTDFEGNPVKELESLASRCSNVVRGFDAGTAIIEFRSTGKGDGHEGVLVTVEDRRPR